ncbi:hypothetical protein GCM10010399_82550 [Dactylosporangium fulvum]|uniref:Uncharacterized protein n=1 Tax=Dactylosporangium fulvum TaxID=53359 RepID=A0ABY5WA25_9ACTN|nr:hypothetical protein [Dactylosporangium fulvum]UWP85874.1 hypothetical protein Dfulv_17145 [Dactylosporangium fulvum]
MTTPETAPATADADTSDRGDVDALRAEVAAEPDAADEIEIVPFADTAVRVKHFLDWPASADDDLSFGRVTAWASKILAGDDFAKVWVKVDPTNRQVIAFFADLEKVTGIPFASRRALPTR